jgi:hypothetical protein
MLYGISIIVIIFWNQYWVLDLIIIVSNDNVYVRGSLIDFDWSITRAVLAG